MFLIKMGTVIHIQCTHEHGIHCRTSKLYSYHPPRPDSRTLVVWTPQTQTSPRWAAGGCCCCIETSSEGRNLQRLSRGDPRAAHHGQLQRVNIKWSSSPNNDVMCNTAATSDVTYTVRLICHTYSVTLMLHLTSCVTLMLQWRTCNYNSDTIHTCKLSYTISYM